MPKPKARRVDCECYAKALTRGDSTFTLVGQDKSAAHLVCLWIAENIETCPAPKLLDALETAISMRDRGKRKAAD